MPTTDFELREPWFHLIAITAFTFLPVVLAPLAKIATTFDMKARFCKSPLRYISGIYPVVFCALAHLGLYTTGLMTHINESDIGEDSFFYESNILLYTCGLLMAFFPHLYTMNWYDYKKQKKHQGDSYGMMSTLANFLCPVVSFVIWALMLVSIILLAIDGRWTPFSVLLGYEVLITLATFYFILEWLWCGSMYRNISYRTGRIGILVIQAGEDKAEGEEKGEGEDVEMQNLPEGQAYGMGRGPRRRKGNPYGY
jgi:hypothetical protein